MRIQIIIHVRVFEGLIFHLEVFNDKKDITNSKIDRIEIDFHNLNSTYSIIFLKLISMALNEQLL